MSPNTPGRIIAAAIVLFWAAMTTMLLRREVFLPRLDAARVRVPAHLTGDGARAYQDDWHGIYYKDTKVGYTHSQVNRLTGDAYSIRNEARINLRLLERDMTIHFEGLAMLDSAGQPERLLYSVVAGPAKLKVKGQRVGNDLHLQVVSAGRVIEKTIPLSPQLSLSNAITPSLYWPALEMGQTYTLDVLDPISLTTSQAKVRVIGREPLAYRGTTANTTVVEFEINRLTFRVWVSEAGIVLRQESDLGWYLVREDRKTATTGIARGAELQKSFEQFATVSTEHYFADSKGLRMLRVQLEGISPEGLSLEGAQQRLVDPASMVVEIVRTWPKAGAAPELPVRDPSLAAFLEPDPFVQSDDPRIAERAQQIIGDETNSWRAAKRLGRWVYDNVEKDLVASIPSAVEVLETLRGDCNEHTTLFTALARSAGIPTRFAVGIVYNEGRYYYHAWPEVFVGQWVAMDPTFGQDVADATHIKLLEGDLTQQTALMGVLGRLTVRVLADSETGPVASAATS